ncbi:helix-turn-helix transcriptional regulator [Polynucleobacter sp. MWH-Spelu-300-X4]|uniref:LuxR C-terminal-related transcriptional regulator n=1 Tax=Polynucleobacter sp. MWH-Spelu-300-X4 TaxID=2689109 RepID=UPI001BFE819A|nr:helix-turn-helix transcriptional regulator [Polynucleobacter sp. MWH-Spelu-300-X4]QWD79428.1 helix-turn-helix transcriptional regulator [Polynucleobacter sp. MWH-Spelu-300-X4]
MLGIHTLTVLYLTGLASLGQALIYFLLLGRKVSREQAAWLGYQLLMGLGFLLLASGLVGEVADFYVLSVLFVLGAYLARFVAMSLSLGAALTKRFLGLGLGTIVFVGILFSWCHSLGAPLGSLETIVLLPLGVASGLTAKYLWDQRQDLQLSPMLLMTYILCLECAIYGVLAIGALAGIGQDYVHPETLVPSTVALISFVIQLALPMLWVIDVAIKKQETFAGVLKLNLSATTKNNKTSGIANQSVSSKRKKDAVSADANKNSADSVQDSHLTAKELEVLRLVVSGKKNKEIADELQISEASVKVHKSRMTAKLGVKTLPELTLSLQQIDAGSPQESVPVATTATAAVEIASDTTSQNQS